MGSYELDEKTKTLHYTGDGWCSVKLTDKEIVKFKAKKISGYELFNNCNKEVD